MKTTKVRPDCAVVSYWRQMSKEDHLDDCECMARVCAEASGASGAKGAGVAAIGGGASGSGAGAAWNQLCLQFAQRTVRPSAPIALSGTR